MIFTYAFTYLIMLIISSNIILNTFDQTQVFWSYMFVIFLCLLSYNIGQIVFPNLHFTIGFIITFITFSILLLCTIPSLALIYIMTFANIFTFGFLSNCPIGCVRTSNGKCDCI